MFIYSVGNVIIVENLSNRQQQHLIGHSEYISRLTLHPNKNILASAVGTPETQDSAPIILWDYIHGKELMRLVYHDKGVQTMEFSDDGRFLISVGIHAERSLVVWLLESGEIIASAETPTATHCVKWLPFRRGKELEFVTAGEDEIIFWKLPEDLQLLMQSVKIDKTQLTDDPKKPIHFTSIQLSYDNTLWVSTDTGSIVSVDVSNNQMKHVWPDVHDGEIDEMCWRRNCVITGGVDKKLKRWVCKNKIEKTFELESSMDLDGNIISMTFDDQGITGIVSTSESTIWYIDWEASKKGSDKPDCMRLVSSHLSYITGLHYCDHKLVSCSGDESIRLWDVKNHVVQQLLQFQVHGLSTTCICFGKNGDYCIAGYSDGSLHTWDLKKVCVSSKNRLHKAPVTCMVVTKDGTKVISGSANGSLIMSDFYTCETKHVIDDHAGKPITCLDICKYTSTDLFLAR